MKRSFSTQLERWRDYAEISGAVEIARRAFVNNSFDGVLTMVGVVMGNFLAGVKDPIVVLFTGLSTAFAIAISGAWSAYLIEAAEQRHAMVDLERSLLRSLDETLIGRAARVGVWFVSIVNGLSPFFAALLIILPFLFAPVLPNIDYAYYASLAMSLVSLFVLGAYLAQISHRSKIRFGIKAVLAGIVSIAVGFGIEFIAA